MPASQPSTTIGPTPVRSPAQTRARRRAADFTPRRTDAGPQTFADLGVPASLQAVLSGIGITTPTPIQAATLVDSIAGRDVLGRGRTGSGKTYAFVLPLLTRLAARPTRTRPGRPRALVLAPTRELVGQIEAAMAPLARAVGLSAVAVYGGVSQQPQARALRAGVDIVVACPGRLEDLIDQGICNLADVEVTVLDEADHMSDLGFLPAVRRLLEQTPRNGQRMLFSATLDAGVDVVVQRFLVDPATHQADSAQTPVATMSHHVLHVSTEERFPVIVDLAAAPGRTVVFTRTKHRAKALARQLNSRGVSAAELHGNLSQGARTRALEDFNAGRVATLVATDIAARGIHVDDVELVVHADPPVEHKAYLHRSGRTARAGKAGTVITLMTDDQVRDVRAMTRAAGVRATTTKISGPGDPIVRELAPGERLFAGPRPTTRLPARPATPQPATRTRSTVRRGRPGRSAVAGSGTEGSTGAGHSAANFSGRSRRH